MRARTSILLLIALSGTACAMPEEHWAILPPDQAKAALHQCSRSTPEQVDGSWEIPPGVAAQLEQDLHKLAELKSHQCCSTGGSVSDPDAFLRQYVGVTIRGKKYVYINAIPVEISIHSKDRGAWRRKPAIICDGGSAFWGALYDPETREFSELAFNGIA